MGAFPKFQDAIRLFDKLMVSGIPAHNGHPQIMPIIIWNPQDLSSLWKFPNAGYDARKHGNTHWCHLCPCTGNKIAYYNINENRFVAN